jgi:hypothetical protein
VTKLTTNSSAIAAIRRRMMNVVIVFGPDGRRAAPHVGAAPLAACRSHLPSARRKRYYFCTPTAV